LQKLNSFENSLLCLVQVLTQSEFRPRSFRPKPVYANLKPTHKKQLYSRSRQKHFSDKKIALVGRKNAKESQG